MFFEGCLFVTKTETTKATDRKIPIAFLSIALLQANHCFGDHIFMRLNLRLGLGAAS